jgi:DNA-binding HxlR family transcriptional regulator
MEPTIQLAKEITDQPARPRNHCSVGKALEVVRNRSAFLVLREVFYGSHRYEEIRDRVGVSDPVASARLKELVEAGLLERRAYRDPGSRTRQGYVLTEMGADLLPALFALMRWGDRWLQGERGDGPVTLRHRDCGAAVELAMRCAEGHDVANEELELTISEAWKVKR